MTQLRIRLVTLFHLFGSLQRMHHWTYLSHFLKSMLFDYFEECKLNPDRLSEYMGNLESFFYQNELEVIDISPLHHFQWISYSDDFMPVTVQASIIVSDSLHIVPVTRKDKLRFWNKFPVSRIDKIL